MTCPKQLRNGPCGGVSPAGECEVYPGVRCVWLVAFERAEAEGKTTDLSLLQRPIDHRQWGRSSWVNYRQGRDEGMWTDHDGRRTLPIIQRPGPRWDRVTTGNGHRPVTDPGRLRRALDSGRFVVTAEIGPPRGADPGAIANADFRAQWRSRHRWSWKFGR